MLVISSLFFIAFTFIILGARGAYPANCFFSVNVDAQGVHWLVDPTGKPFFSKGVDDVNPFGDEGRDGSHTYGDAVKAKFGTDYGKWAAYTAEQLRTWEINSLGAWSADYMFDQGLAYTLILNFALTWRQQSKTPMEFPDIFDPGFSRTVSDIVKEYCAPKANDPYLLGYFLDNELFWGNDHMGDYSLMAMYLNYTGTAGFDEAVKYLSDKYTGDITKLNDAWGVQAASFQNLKVLWPYPKKNNAYIQDSDEFLKIVANQYFNITRRAIRSVDSVHLTLGCKHANIPPNAVMEVEGKYGDVFSWDDYMVYVRPEDIENAWTLTHLPLLIGEYSFRAEDSGLPNTKGSGPLVKTQAERTDDFANYATKAATSPYMLGLHWFRWVDEPKSGRIFDGANSNHGLVNASDDVYEVLTSRMKSVFGGLDTIHSQGKTVPNFKPRCT